MTENNKTKRPLEDTVFCSCGFPQSYPIPHEHDQTDREKLIVGNYENTLWFIWSIEHGAWWKPRHNGYTELLSEAGLYKYREALKIVEGANIGLHDEPHEAMILFIEE
jgi:hypothetical protein